MRFPWFDEPYASRPAIVEYRFNRLFFGLQASPSILGATISHHLKNYKQSEPEMAKSLEEALYVDDLITGEDNVSRAFSVYEKSKQIMSEGGFNLRKWNSNSKELLIAIKNLEHEREGSKSKTTETRQDDESYGKAATTPGNVESSHELVKVLGVTWNTVTDELLFDFSELYKYGRALPETKRSVLKLTAKIFDPIGFLTPFTIEMKILLQELCLEKVDWDGELQGDSGLNSWTLLLEELRCLSSANSSLLFPINSSEIRATWFL